MAVHEVSEGDRPEGQASEGISLQRSRHTPQDGAGLKGRVSRIALATVLALVLLQFSTNMDSTLFDYFSDLSEAVASKLMMGDIGSLE